MALIIYITLVAAVTDDNPGTSLTLLHGNEAEQQRICVSVTRRSEVTVQSHYRMVCDSREVVTFPETHLTSRLTSSTAEHSASHDQDFQLPSRSI